MDFCENPYIRTYVDLGNGTRKWLRMYRYSPEREKELSRSNFKYVLIPCGKCLFCQNKYKSSWAHRMYLESMYHKTCYFITLTYKYNPVWLSKRDLQLFIKRLRFEFGSGLVYFASGEYGSLNGRPHYHMIIFDLPELDIDQNGSNEKIAKLWNKGIVYCGFGDIGSFDYTAGYTAKKMDSSVMYDKKVRPFCIMSKGIGKQFFLDHKDMIYYTDSIIVSNHKDTKSCKVPRYFDKLLEKSDPDLFLSIKDNRNLFVIDDNKNKLDCPDTDIISVYRNKREEHLLRIKQQKYKL